MSFKTKKKKIYVWKTEIKKNFVNESCRKSTELQDVVNEIAFEKYLYAEKIK